MRRFWSITSTVLGLLVLTSIVYGAVIVFDQPLADKEKDMATIKLALEQIGVENPNWQTIVLASSQEVDVPRETLWAAWSQLEDWPTWSQPLHVSSRWTSEAGWQVGAEFEQVLRLGFPLGTLTSPETVGAVVEGERVMWWKDENGIKSCHIWQFKDLGQGRTKVSNVEVFHGAAMGLVKPLITNRIQGMFDQSVEGLIAYARATKL